MVNILLQHIRKKRDSRWTNLFIMNNEHMGMWSQFYGKANTLKGLAVLLLDSEGCDEWKENDDFANVCHPGVSERKKINVMLCIGIINKSFSVYCILFLLSKELKYCTVTFLSCVSNVCCLVSFLCHVSLRFIFHFCVKCSFQRRLTLKLMIHQEFLNLWCFNHLRVANPC